MLIRQFAVIAALCALFFSLVDVAAANLQEAVAQSRQSGKPLLVVVSGEG